MHTWEYIYGFNGIFTGDLDVSGNATFNGENRFNGESVFVGDMMA
jgi:hypothetical protein